MGMEIHVEIVKRETIKPSSPTPTGQTDFQLCLLDQLAPVAYGPLVLFYSSTNNQYPRIAEQIRSSLSETLTQFYPLAGRIKDDASIECIDHGAVFVEARVNCLLSTFLEEPDAQVIRNFIPIEIESPEARRGYLVLVQATFFACGGVAIGLCISHKIADAATMMTFIRSWAFTAAGYGENIIPLFDAASIFPPQNFSFTKPAVRLKKENFVTRRFVFDASNISALKTRAACEAVKNPTRVEALTALIWKCAMNASRSNSEESRLSILSQSVNLRGRVVPPLPEHTVGHLVGHFASQATDSHLIELQGLAGQLRKGMQDFEKNYVKKLQGDDSYRAISESFKEAGDMLREGNIDFYISTSLCRFPFYDIDFGWGKPTWVTIPTGAYKNVAVMIDTRDGNGIEAWVTLREEDMAFFERDQELLAVSSLNPSALNPIKPRPSL